LAEALKSPQLPLPGCKDLGHVHDFLSVPRQQVDSIRKIDETILEEQMCALEEPWQPIKLSHDSEDWCGGFIALMVIPLFIIDVVSIAPVCV
jgi:hypothetical protein